jgi:hypothetical protein
MNDSIITSAVLQAAFGVCLAWPLSLTRLDRNLASPMTQKRLLQAHLDNLFMAALKFGVAVAIPNLPRPVALALIIGGWTNPMLFLLAIAAKENKKIMAAFSVPSFVIVTYSWFGIAWYWLNRDK